MEIVFHYSAPKFQRHCSLLEYDVLQSVEPAAKSLFFSEQSCAGCVVQTTSTWSGGGGLILESWIFMNFVQCSRNFGIQQD